MTETSDKASFDIVPPLHHISSLSTVDDEANDRSNVTPSEWAEISSDLYGLSTSFAASCRLTDDQEGLRALDAELARMPTERKSSFLVASKFNPKLVDNAHRMPFLRCEDMDAQRAANRLALYWQKRREVFGPSRCYFPLTLHGALRDDVAAWSQEFCQLLPRKDKFGRAIIFFDPSRLKNGKGSNCSPGSLLRVIWYVHHVAMADPEVQQKGFVNVGFEKHSTITSVFFGGSEQRFLQKKVPELSHVLPAKVRALHMCHPIVFMVLPVFKYFIERRERLRLMVHEGSDEKVLEDLAHYGMTSDILPTQLGGEVFLNAEEWVQRRIDIETAALASSNKHLKEERKPGNVATPVAKVSSHVADDVPEQAEEGSRSDRVETDNIVAVAQKISNAKKRAGRRGDPRMNKATKAKLADPNLSLLDAVLEGGFVFSNLGESICDKGVIDDDGVSLYQRKNQLSRRLRAASASNK